MDSIDTKAAEIAEKMRAEQLPEIAIDTFLFYYRQLAEGQTGRISESDIEPVEFLPNAEKFGDDLAESGHAALAKTIMINLNGGLGTSMGLDKAKSLLEVKNDLSFLDILAKQATTAGVPLVLMNSFSTREDSIEALKKYPELVDDGIPLDFIQHKVPKIDASDLTAVNWMADERLEWCPPGHGDIYTALVTSGMLGTLLQAGYRYAFVSNADNLGACLDERILGYFVENKLPFMMEAADRTEADRKGGHLARRISDGHLVLRESAQCPSSDEAAFQDVQRHRYFNTNSLWINLESLKQTLAERDNVLGLPMICNEKPVDPKNPLSTPVYQLETAMGAAISVFEGAQAIRVPRTRFAPVKTTDDLLVVRSDATTLDERFMIVPNPDRKLGAPVVKLDKRFYKHIDDMEARFPHGAPSLMYCSRLEIKGDIRFGKNVILQGDVKLINDKEQQAVITDGKMIKGVWRA